MDSIKNNIFTEKMGKVFIGGVELDESLRSVLRDEAIYINHSRLVEILNATIIQESFELGVLQSENWDNVMFAKALNHWNYVLLNILNKLEAK